MQLFARFNPVEDGLRLVIRIPIAQIPEERFAKMWSALKELLGEEPTEASLRQRADVPCVECVIVFPTEMLGLGASLSKVAEEFTLAAKSVSLEEKRHVITPDGIDLEFELSAA